MNVLGAAPAIGGGDDSGGRREEARPADPGEILQDIESLIESLGRVASPEARAEAQALVRAVLDLHATGLARILELAAGGAPGAFGKASSWVDALAKDDLVSSLLLLHGLHPLSLEARVRAALVRASPSGWTSELVDASGAVLRITLTRVGDPKRSATVDRVRTMIEQAVGEVAPDAEGLEFTGVLGDDAPFDFVPIARLRTRGPLPGSEP